MIFSNINIKSELIREKSRQQRIMNEVYDLLNDEIEKDAAILARLKSGRDRSTNSENVHADLAAENIFRLEEIKKICIRFRLRFLESTYFKAEYPYEAISNIKSLERTLGKEIVSFHIIAPEKAFELENINKDPLLFANLGNGQYYLLHQWGTDLAWYKRILCWPLQNFKTFLITLFLVCAAFSFSIPTSFMQVFSFSNEMYLRIWLSIHTFIAMFGISLWAGLSFDKTFSSLNWNSKYYNY